MAAEAHGGRALPEKFEEIAQECTFAVFLMTADDCFRTADGSEIWRARQNVVLEIGYFWGALGRRKRVAFLVDHDLDLPSDIQGVGWIPLTADLGETILRLRRELEDAGLVQRRKP
jgi:predicted nucleotide-binding protein